MNFWVNLFTGNTWQEFRRAGAGTAGFREHTHNMVGKIKCGDVLLCYLTGVMRWVGALEVMGPTRDERRIWADDAFPVRLEVKPIIMLDPQHGIPMGDLEGKVHFYRGARDRGTFRGLVRRSPNLLAAAADGELIASLRRAAESSPVARPVDEHKLARKPFHVEKRKPRPNPF